MNKKLMAVAVATALGTPAVAFAQASTVQIYGTVYIEYSYIDQGDKIGAGAFPGAAIGGGSLVRVDHFQSPGTNIGFKGEEALGGGLSAWFQCESTAGNTGSDAGTWCGRNSALGLKGGFGNIFFGNWDTPFKRINGVTRGTLNETGFLGTGFLMFGNSASYLGRGTQPGAFLRRQNDTVNYESPTWGGFRLMGQASSSRSAVAAGPVPAAATGAIAAVAPGSTGITAGVSGAKPRLYSIAAQYDNGPLHLSGAYEQHKNYQPVGVVFSGKDNALQLGAAYTFPVGGGLKLAGIWSRQEYDTTATTEINRKSWQVAVDWKIVGPHGVRTGYTKAGDTKGSAAGAGGLLAGSTLSGTSIAATAGDNGADMWQVSYYYTMSKRTEAGIGYVRLNNDAAGQYVLGGNTIGVATAPGIGGVKPGDKQTGIGGWLRHTF